MSKGVSVEIDITAMTKAVAKLTDEGIAAVAKEAAKRAKASTAFVDKTGNLRKSIKAQKSERADRGEKVWLVKAGAPHAHLVEDGHAQVTKDGTVVKHVPGTSFLKNAVESVKPEAEQIAAKQLKKLNLKV